MNWLSTVASQDKKTIQQKPQLEQRLPTVVDMLPYSQGSVQKVLTLWSVEVPYSDEAVIPFFEQLGTIANRAFILTDSDIHQRNRQQVIGVIYFYENDWRLPLESWYGNIILDDQIDEVYVLTFRANTYKLKTSIYKYELNKIQSKGLFPLSFDPKKFQEWPKIANPIFFEEKKLFGSRGYGFRRISTISGPTDFWICAERDEPTENPTFLRFDLRSKKLTEVTFQDKPDKPDSPKTEK